MGSAHPQPHPKHEEKLFNIKQMINSQTIQNPLLYYDFLQHLGEGSYSNVYKARSRITGQFRAIKKVPKEQCETKAKHLFNEFAILRQLDHPNIIRMYQLFEDKQSVYIVTQLLPSGDCLQLLHGRKAIAEQLVFNLFYKTLLAIRYLHKNNVMHRDIKIQNIIYDQQHQIFKLVDFGSSLVFADEGPRQRRLTGSIHYIAPDVLNKYYDKSCDIWSLGICLYVLLSGNAPFVGDTHPEIIDNIKNQPLNFQENIWNYRTKEVQNLLSRMLQKNFEKRISINDILQHSWVQFHLNKMQMKFSNREAVENCLNNIIRFKRIKISSIQLGILVFMFNFIWINNQQKEIAQAFWAINTVFDGQIDQNQLAVALSTFLKYPKKQAIQTAKQIMATIDLDDSGDITFSQFSLAAIDLKCLISSQNLAKTFAFIDTDSSSSLSAQQIQVRLGCHHDIQYYRRIVSQFDRDGDGEIDQNQFEKMMKAILKYY